MGKRRAKTGEGKRLAGAERLASESKSGPASLRSANDDLDEVDAFHAERDKITFDDTADAAAFEDDDAEEAVMDIGGDALDDSEESSADDGAGESSDEDEDEEEEEEEGADEDDDDSESDDSDDEEARNIARMTENWGKSKRRFYGSDNQRLQLEAEDDGGTQLEEEAAEEQRQRQLATMNEGDFDVDASSEDDEQEKNAQAGQGRDKNRRGADTSKAVAVEKVRRRTSHMSKEDKMQIVLSDSPELLDLLDDFKGKLSEVQDQIEPLLTRIEEGALRTSGGLSYLEVKHQLLLNYCVNVVFYLLLKARGKSVRRHPVVQQLVEMRTILERLRPLDSKLKYQIDKLLKAASRGSADGVTLHEDDPLRHKPRPELLVSKDGDDDGDGSESTARAGRSASAPSNGLYHAPKMAAVPYELDSKAAERQEREAAKRARKLSRSALLKDMREDISDAPREVRDRTYKDDRVQEEEEEKRLYEEERFVRLTATKKEKQRKKRLEREAARMDTIADIGDFSELRDIAASGALGGDDGDFGDGDGDGDRESVSALARLQGEKRRMSRFQNLNRTLNTVKQRAETKASAAVGSGDADVPLHDPEEKMKLRIQKPTGEDGDEGFDDDFFGGGGSSAKAGSRQSGKRHRASDDASGAQHPLYSAARRTQQAKKKAKFARIEKATAAAAGAREYEHVAQDEKRGVTWEIMKNQGLKAQKRKIDRNPRVKKRVQYKKAVVRRKGQVRDVRTNEGDQYGGETSGVTGVTRSRKF